MNIVLASDHAGVAMKAALMARLKDAGGAPVDLGPDDGQSVDYPDYAERLASRMEDDDGARGILICGTGIGMSIAANRRSHIRAALCHSVTDARLARQHNDANVLVLGARTMGLENALDCLMAFLTTKFEGGRHQGRVRKLS